MTIKIFTTGGTIDKVYFDAASEFQVGESLIHEVFREANVVADFSMEALMRKDSLEMTDADRQLIVDRVRDCEHDRILVTHGTDTMTQTAEALRAVTGKTIVLTGAMQPARFRSTDAVFNIGFALAAVQLLAPGIYIAMNGRVFAAGEVQKNRDAHRFEVRSPD